MSDAWERYQTWLAYPAHSSDVRAELTAIAGDDLAIRDRFGRDLDFGTGGLRGLMGPGSNRMNTFTVRWASIGLARYVLSCGQNAAERGVVVAYDSRWQSPEFALEVAQVVAAAGVNAYLFDHLCPTPELSFAVRQLQAFAGVVITASHNPKEYNGYKVYGSDGGQLLTDDATRIKAEMALVDDLFSIPVLSCDEALHLGRLRWLDAAMDAQYEQAVVEAVSVQSLSAAQRAALRIVYTPLHGAGAVPVQRVLEQAGYTQVHVEASQALPDGAFPTVASPNPEEPDALARAIRQAEVLQADLVLGTDPDADRVGVAVRDSGGRYALLTGNQVGGLLVDFLIESRGRSGTLSANATVYKTIVTSELGAEIARAAGVAVENTLTGFKYIGHLVTRAEQTGSAQLLFGYEESYGYLISPIVRDKDAVQACLLIAELAAHLRAQGKTLMDALESLYRRVGYFREELQSVHLPGENGVREMADVMGRLRLDPGLVAGELPLVAVEDYARSIRTIYAEDGRAVAEEQILLPTSDVLKFMFAGGAWLAVRPSGTEPKMKLYLGACGSTRGRCDDALASLRRAIESVLGGAVGTHIA